jgi:hypothetical protein
MGCCRVEFLLQTLPKSLTSQVVASETMAKVKEALQSLLKVESFSGSSWALARLPLRLGGLGLRDAELIRPAIRLASLINIKTSALELGADEQVLQRLTQEALTDYYTALGLPLLDAPEPVPGKELQSSLSEPFHLRRRSALVEGSAAPDRERLNSLSTPHATSWTAGSPRISSLDASEVRYGIRWLLGIPFRSENYTCPDCGQNADIL